MTCGADWWDAQQDDPEPEPEPASEPEADDEPYRPIHNLDDISRYQPAD
jgi:hypothetical protein